LRGFADSTSVCWQRTGRDPSRPPCGPFLRPAATAYGARVARILRARAKSKRDSQSQSPSSACGTFSRTAGEGRSGAKAKSELQVCGTLLRLGCAGGAVTGAPMQWRSGGEKARRAARRDASQLAASPWRDCQPTPEPLRGVAAQDARRPLHRGALSFGYFLDFGLPALRPSGQLRRSRRSCGAVSTQRKVTRSPKASESVAIHLFARRKGSVVRSFSDCQRRTKHGEASAFRFPKHASQAGLPTSPMMTIPGASP
ncbi:hypothetical protein SAMN05216289_1131, partial [Dokdonella immobilis]